MRIECALCPYISEDEDDFENHFMTRHSPVENNLIRYMVVTTKEDTRVSNKSVTKIL